MKYLVLFALLSFSAVADTQDCIPFNQAWQLSESWPSHIPEEKLPGLPDGWSWVKVYRPSRDPDLQTYHWMSWPNGKTLTVCRD